VETQTELSFRSRMHQKLIHVTIIISFGSDQRQNPDGQRPLPPAAKLERRPEQRAGTPATTNRELRPGQRGRHPWTGGGDGADRPSYDGWTENRRYRRRRRWCISPLAATGNRVSTANIKTQNCLQQLMALFENSTKAEIT